MSLNIHQYIVADTQIVGLFGERGLGVSSLKFSCSFMQANAEPKEQDMFIDCLRATVSVKTATGQAYYLGRGEFEGPLVLRRRQSTMRFHSLLRTDISDTQLLEIEESRGSDGLVFEIVLVGLAHMPQDTYATQETLRYDVNLSSWTQVLNQLGFADSFVVGVQIPVNPPEQLAAAVNFLQVGRRSLAAGENDAVVGACRQALDSLDSVVKHQETVIAARASKPARPRDQTKRQRALAIFDSLRHYTHLAHHVDERGRPEIYSRRDASMILTATCTLIAAAMEW
ncbi:hypothetical protein ACW9YQ_14730 (plasmid) [Paraburkholderia strydomiana]